MCGFFPLVSTCKFKEMRGCTVVGLYCKRPIQCLASSELSTPHSLTALRVCTLPPLVRGEDTLAGWRGAGGSIVRKTPDTALYSIYVSTLWGALYAITTSTCEAIHGKSPTILLLSSYLAPTPPPHKISQHLPYLSLVFILSLNSRCS